MIKYSVIIPAFNIEYHIQSLSDLAQNIIKKRNDVEFIIVDDGSTDSTYSLLKNKFYFSIYQQKNKGVSAARNTGLSHAKGEYILFLDADDNYNLDIFDVIDKNISTSPEILAFNYKITNKKSANPKEKLAFNKFNALELLFSKKITLHICAFCFSTKYLRDNKILFPKGFGFGEDSYFIVKAILATNNEFLYLPELLFHYQIQNSSTVTSKLNQNKISVIYLYSKLYDEIKNEKTSHYLTYFIQRTYIYLYKLGISNGVSEKDVLCEMKKNIVILDKTIKIKTSIKFKIAKLIVIKFHNIILKFLDKKINKK
ncbi:glycosyltransferase family 2 protein [Providencia rettgeri]